MLGSLFARAGGFHRNHVLREKFKCVTDKNMKPYNATKKRTLGVFQDQTWMDVPTVAKRAGIRPVRRAYSYLAHLEGLGLLLRGYTASRKLHYRITPRGIERLAWLRSQTEHSDTHQGSLVTRDKADPLQSLISSLLSEMRPSGE